MRLNLSGEDLKLLEKVTGAKVEKAEAENTAFFDNLFKDIGKFFKNNENEEKPIS